MPNQNDNEFRVVELWCWGNENEVIATFKTKKEAYAYMRERHLPRFNGFQGYEVQG